MSVTTPDANRETSCASRGSGTQMPHRPPKSCILKEWRGQDFSPHFSQMIASEVCFSSSHQPFLFSKIMRKIETQMIAAVQNDQRWSSANTTVVPGWEGTSDVYLHGSRIATIGQDWMQLFDGGYQSKTTKSRLNALLSAFGMDGEYVFQKNFQWFVNYNGSPIPFFDGMRLA